MDRIFFGNKGGFTNMGIDYVLFENGKLCKMQPDNIIKVCKVNRKQMCAVDSVLTSMGFRDMKVDEPGNMTYYITVINTDYKNSVKWSDHEQNPQLKALYDNLMELVKAKL